MNWKPIENYPNYEISDCGMVLSHNIGNILKPGKNTEGYLLVILCKNGEKKTCKIHRLVAQAFIPNPENKKCVDHINRDKTNNHIDNLRWATHSENGQNKGYQCNNKLGIKNIYYCKTKYTYKYEKTIEGKRIRKTFLTLDEAIQFKKTFSEDLIYLE